MTTASGSRSLFEKKKLRGWHPPPPKKKPQRFWPICLLPMNSFATFLDLSILSSSSHEFRGRCPTHRKFYRDSTYFYHTIALYNVLSLFVLSPTERICRSMDIPIWLDTVYSNIYLPCQVVQNEECIGTCNLKYVLHYISIVFWAYNWYK